MSVYWYSTYKQQKMTRQALSKDLKVSAVFKWSDKLFHSFWSKSPITAGLQFRSGGCLFNKAPFLIFWYSRCVALGKTLNMKQRAKKECNLKTSTLLSSPVFTLFSKKTDLGCLNAKVKKKILKLILISSSWIQMTHSPLNAWLRPLWFTSTVNLALTPVWAPARSPSVTWLQFIQLSSHHVIQHLGVPCCAYSFCRSFFAVSSSRHTHFSGQSAAVVKHTGQSPVTSHVLMHWQLAA